MSDDDMTELEERLAKLERTVYALQQTLILTIAALAGWIGGRIVPILAGWR